MNFKNKAVTVIGLGKSGFAAAKFLCSLGAKVRVTENSARKEVLESADFLKNSGVLVETGGHTESFVEGSSLVVTSPGVPKKSPPLVVAKRSGIPVISEVELASLFCKGAKVAVTGSNGKTTTSHLIHRILRVALRKSVLCGNVGYSFLEAVNEIDRRTVAVIELSSFQLEDSPTFRPKIAVVLNISPNHLDRHGDMENYIRAKAGIFKNQKNKDVLVLNHDDPVVRAMAKRARSKVIFFSKKPIPQGLFARNGKIVFKDNRQEKVLLDTGHFKLKGDHNLENILAAVAVAWLLNIRMQAVQETLDTFRTLEHRIEPIGTLGGIHFINDSKSTTVESTKAAILAVKGPVILIAGGRDKGASFHEIEPLLEERVKGTVLYGEARETIAASWKHYDRCRMEKDFHLAVAAAFRMASRRDTVLLSPMCTSFDQFSCFEERGEVFKKIFKELKAEAGSPQSVVSGRFSSRNQNSPMLR